MTEEQANELATAILKPVKARPGDHKIIARKLRRMFTDLEFSLSRAAYDCEGKNQYEIADILCRAINGVMATEMDLIELEFL